jgi:hypothetical protein
MLRAILCHVLLAAVALGNGRLTDGSVFGRSEGIVATLGAAVTDRKNYAVVQRGMRYPVPERLSISNFKKGKAKIVFIHITHQGGTSMCKFMRKVTRVLPEQGCNAKPIWWKFQAGQDLAKPFPETDFVAFEFNSPAPPPTAVGRRPAVAFFNFSQFPFESERVVSMITVRDPMQRFQSDFTSASWKKLYNISSGCVVAALYGTQITLSSSTFNKDAMGIYEYVGYQRQSVNLQRVGPRWKPVCLPKKKYDKRGKLLAQSCDDYELQFNGTEWHLLEMANKRVAYRGTCSTPCTIHYSKPCTTPAPCKLELPLVIHKWSKQYVRPTGMESVDKGLTMSSGRHDDGFGRLLSNFQLRILADVPWPEKVTRQHLAIAKANIDSFSIVVDLDCFDATMHVVSRLLNLTPAYSQHRKHPPVEARARCGNDTMFDWLLEENALDRELYAYAQKKSLVVCPSTPEER